MPDTWNMIEWERLRLADDTADLTDEQWGARTRCGDWTVREVVAHVSEIPPPLKAIIGVITKLGNVDAFVDETARERAKAPTESLVADLRAFATSRQLPPGVPPLGQLVDTIVHGEDIRRAVGETIADRPPEHVGRALDFAVRSGGIFRGKRRAAGLTLAADDMDWHHGAGPEARGPALSILGALLGRSDDAARLHGDGAALLAQRAG